jgi:hypothetical protein
MNWRRPAHDWSLIFCAAVGAYLISVLVATRLSLWLAGVAGSWESTVARVALGVVALDLSKLPGLLLAAVVIGASLRASPWLSASGLVLLIYLLDAAVTALLDQVDWLYAEPVILLCRLAAAAVLAWVTMLVLRRRRPRAPSSSGSPPPSETGSKNAAKDGKDSRAGS